MSGEEEIKKTKLDNFGSMQYSFGCISITLKKGKNIQPSISILDSGNNVKLTNADQVEKAITILQKLIKSM